ncbi:HAAS signaling domain-containing protein [Mumia sp. DW29H23]|uniref:HAAS signaling domain-containing protein n=1 Tax=Mumia sp. DW29H23 TaxID=3421241 RepID=UPI003D6969E1
MTATLTDRYVRAATRWLPGGSRRDVEAELRERIADTLAARGDSPAAEREVLEEMGDPLLVAVEYTGREPRLIGPRLFMPWLRLLLLLLAIVPPLAAAGHLIGALTDDEAIAPSLLGAVGVAVGAAIQVAFWVTAVFAVLDWTGALENEEVEPWSVDKLPAASRPGQSFGDTIATVAFLAVMAGLLVWQQIASPISSDGESIPVLDPALWSWWVPAVLALLAIEVGFTLWVYRTGWSWTAAAVNAAIAVAFAALTLPALAAGDFLNPELVTSLEWDASTVDTVLQWITVGVVLVTAWEIIDDGLKARRAVE